jgi:hypothetical protein
MPHGKKQQLTHFTNKHITYYLPHIKHYTLLPLTLHITLKWVTHNTKKLTHHAKTSNTRYKCLASMSVETASQCFKVDFKPPMEETTQTFHRELLEVCLWIRTNEKEGTTTHMVLYRKILVNVSEFFKNSVHIYRRFKFENFSSHPHISFWRVKKNVGMRRKIFESG